MLLDSSPRSPRPLPAGAARSARRVAAAAGAATLCLLLAAAAGATDFSGRWIFRPALSTNAGMMAALEMRLAIQQSPAFLAIHEDSVFQGQKSSRDVRYDLAGRPSANPGPMGDASETVSHWDGNRLVTTWTAQGAVAGSRVVRVETRSLAADGKHMTVESVRGSAPPIVLVFERE